MQRTPLRRTHPPGGVQHDPRQHKLRLCKPGGVPAAINQFMNISCATDQIDSLTVRQKYRDLAVRPQLHVILQGGPGSLKSTILEEVGAIHNVTPYSYVTYAAMIGSIDPINGDLIPGLVWQTRKKPLLLDEFRTGERGDTGSIDVLLGVLESGRYKRRVGQQTRPFNEEDGDLYYRVKDGEIEVKTRFPCTIATMKNLDKARSEKYRALTQRCIPIRFALEPEELDSILQGKPFYEYRKYDGDREITISRQDYRRILDIAKKFRNVNPKFQEVFARAVGDLCRITAVLGFIDIPLCMLVCHLKADYKIEHALNLVEKATKAF